MEEKEIEKVNEILEIARELGVEEEDIQEVSERSKRISVSILSAIFGFVLGFIIGIFFSGPSDTSYPYRSGFPPGIVLTKRAYKVLSVILGIIGVFSGFAVSVRISWPLWGIQFPPSEWVGWYGVFAKRSPLSGLGRKPIERT